MSLVPSIKRTYGRHRQITPTSSESDEETTSTALLSQDQHASSIVRQESEAKQDRYSFQHPDSETEFEDASQNEPAISMAPRLHTTLPSVSQIMQGLESDDGEDDEEAYEKLKKQLAPKLSAPAAVAFETPETARTVEDQDNSNSGAFDGPQCESVSKVAVLALKARQELRADSQSEETETVAPIRPRQYNRVSDTDTDSEDIEAEIRMSSARKTTRRAAGKKALEEMHRETERLQRNMTLAPNAQVKMKLKMSDFLSKIGYVTKEQLSSSTPEPNNTKPEDIVVEPPNMAQPAETAQSSLTDVPPYSEAFAPDLEDTDEDIELPTFTGVSSSLNCPPASPRNLPMGVPTLMIERTDIMLDSDSSSEAELPPHLKSHRLLFKKRDYNQIKRDRRAAKFNAMARPESPTKLHARAERERKRELIAQVGRQAKAERQNREAAMRAAGITVLSAEEKQEEALKLESLIDQARKQAEQIRKLEAREDSRKKAEQDGVNFEDSEEEGDDEWRSNADKDALESGDSGDESHGMSDSDVEGHSDGRASNGDFVAETSKQVCELASPVAMHNQHPSTVLQDSLEEIEDDSGDDTTIPKHRRRQCHRAKGRQIMDEDDLHGCQEDSKSDDTAAEVVDEIGLTQFFLATPCTNRPEIAQKFDMSQFARTPETRIADSMQELRKNDIATNVTPAPTSNLVTELTSKVVVPDRILSSQAVDHEYKTFPSTQLSFYDPPSPDGDVLPLMIPHFSAEFTQATEVDTDEQAFADSVAYDPVGNSPATSQKSRLSRLHRRDNIEHDTSREDLGSVNVFKRMRQAVDAEQHQKSRQALLDDRAVESDDEYAGMGGASDEEADDEVALATELQNLIDDHDIASTNEETRQTLAALDVRRALEKDEKEVNTLMNDLNNGGLRRKRGAGLLDMEDSEDEEEEEARYKARQAQMRARLLEAQNLTSLADNPKTKAFIEALEDRPENNNFIEICGEEDQQDCIAETTLEVEAHAGDFSTQDCTPNTVAEVPSQLAMGPPVKSIRKLNKRKTQADVRNELSFLREDDEDSLSTDSYDPSFVPTLKRERSSLTIEDRAQLSRENSATSWRDPRTEISNEQSVYSQLASVRRTESTGSLSTVTVVVSKGMHLASRMATKAVNYHAKAARALKSGLQDRQHGTTQSSAKKALVDPVKRSNKRDVLKLLA